MAESWRLTHHFGDGQTRVRTFVHPKDAFAWYQFRQALGLYQSEIVIERIESEVVLFGALAKAAS